MYKDEKDQLGKVFMAGELIWSLVEILFIRPPRMSSLSYELIWKII
jgi:hypothetical protein